MPLSTLLGKNLGKLKFRTIDFRELFISLCTNFRQNFRTLPLLKHTCFRVKDICGNASLTTPARFYRYADEEITQFKFYITPLRISSSVSIRVFSIKEDKKFFYCTLNISDGLCLILFWQVMCDAIARF